MWAFYAYYTKDDNNFVSSRTLQIAVALCQNYTSIGDKSLFEFFPSHFLSNMLNKSWVHNIYLHKYPQFKFFVYLHAMLVDYIINFYVHFILGRLFHPPQPHPVGFWFLLLQVPLISSSPGTHVYYLLIWVIP